MRLHGESSEIVHYRIPDENQREADEMQDTHADELRKSAISRIPYLVTVLNRFSYLANFAQGSGCELWRCLHHRT